MELLDAIRPQTYETGNNGEVLIRPFDGDKHIAIFMKEGVPISWILINQHEELVRTRVDQDIAKWVQQRTGNTIIPTEDIYALIDHQTPLQTKFIDIHGNNLGGPITPLTPKILDSAVVADQNSAIKAAIDEKLFDAIKTTSAIKVVDRIVNGSVYVVPITEELSSLSYIAGDGNMKPGKTLKAGEALVIHISDNNEVQFLTQFWGRTSIVAIEPHTWRRAGLPNPVDFSQNKDEQKRIAAHFVTQLAQHATSHYLPDGRSEHVYRSAVEEVAQRSKQYPTCLGTVIDNEIQKVEARLYAVAKGRSCDMHVLSEVQRVFPILPEDLVEHVLANPNPNTWVNVLAKYKVVCLDIPQQVNMLERRVGFIDLQDARADINIMIQAKADEVITAFIEEANIDTLIGILSEGIENESLIEKLRSTIKAMLKPYTIDELHDGLLSEHPEILESIIVLWFEAYLNQRGKDRLSRTNQQISLNEYSAQAKTSLKDIVSSAINAVEGGVNIERRTRGIFSRAFFREWFENPFPREFPIVIPEKPGYHPIQRISSGLRFFVKRSGEQLARINRVIEYCIANRVQPVVYIPSCPPDECFYDPQKHSAEYTGGRLTRILQWTNHNTLDGLRVLIPHLKQYGFTPEIVIGLADVEAYAGYLRTMSIEEFMEYTNNAAHLMRVRIEQIIKDTYGQDVQYRIIETKYDPVSGGQAHGVDRIELVGEGLPHIIIDGIAKLVGGFGEWDGGITEQAEQLIHGKLYNRETRDDALVVLRRKVLAIRDKMIRGFWLKQLGVGTETTDKREMEMMVYKAFRSDMLMYTKVHLAALKQFGRRAFVLTGDCGPMHHLVSLVAEDTDSRGTYGTAHFEMAGNYYDPLS